MIRLASIDPGIDRVSIAYFVIPAGARVGRWSSATLLERAQCFECVHVIKTSAADPLVNRLHGIAEGIMGELTQYRPARVSVELPPVGGIYQRNRGSAKAMGGKFNESLTKLYLATGAIVAAAIVVLGLAAVETLPAQRAPKAQRLAIARNMLRMAGKPECTNDDDADAVGIGLGAPWPY